MKRKFRVVFDMVLDDSEYLSDMEMEEFKTITCQTIKENIDAGFDYASEEFFGESLSGLGLRPPHVVSVEEIK